LHAVIALQEELGSRRMDRDRMMRRAAECVRDVVSADYAAVALPCDEALEYTVLAGQPLPAAPIRLHRGASLTGWCLENRRAVRCDEIEADPRGSVVARGSLGARSLLNAPLVAQGTAIGVLSTLSRQPRAFTDADLRAVELIAGVLSAAMLNASTHADREVLLAERSAALEHVRQSEELHRALTEHSEDLINILDARGTITYVCPAVTRVLGWTVAEMQGKLVREHVHPDDRHVMIATHRELLAEPGGSRHMTVRLRHKDGTWRYLEGYGRNLLHVPAVRGITSNARDVTERRLLEEQLRQSQKMEAVGQLAGGVAHDFNNVLSAITGYGELLAQDLTDGDLRENVLEINRAAWRGAELTKKLLAFSRKQVMRVEVLDAVEVVRGIEKMLRHVIPDDVTLQASYPAEPLPVEIDRTQLEQVLMNLIINARDALPNGGCIRLELERQLVSDIGRIRVIDNGIGMSEETRSHIFEPFFTTKGEGKGTGLGLAVVYGIIRQLRGSIAVESRLGTGTEFTIRLPLHRAV